MKMALWGNTLVIAEADNHDFSMISSWGMMRWDKASKTLRGPATLELLDKLAEMRPLATGGITKDGRQLPSVEGYRQHLRRIQNAVDQQRVTEKPDPVYKYPVKIPLYAHQVRAANMAMLTFGWVPPEAAAK